ncbi:MAG TPA: hypothetical protein VJU79_10600 [Candidatus Dormibacteraeota bacterium]|nr:hypothetical protein [Candidatus Dormibacteraeota bacterium]
MPGDAFALPVSSGATLASVTMKTSPDGGIYQNPDLVRVVMVTRHAVDAVAGRAGAVAAQWKQLHALGDFTFVGLSIKNNGKAWSDAALNASQIASDFAPDGTSSGALRHFYHPMFPLAMLSEKSSDSSCTLHIDPGETALAVLVYPPLRSTDHIVWGMYQDFAVQASFGGGVPDRSVQWQVNACVSPQPAPQ